MNDAQGKQVLLCLVLMAAISVVMVAVLAPVKSNLTLSKLRRDIAEIAQAFFLMAFIALALPFTFIVLLWYTWPHLGWLTNTLAYLAVVAYIASIVWVNAKFK